MISAIALDVPATSANLGPGYDSFGLALGLCDTLEIRVCEAPVDPAAVVAVEGEGAAELPRDRSHLIMAVIDAVLTDLNPDAAARYGDRLALHCRNRIPHSRGLGSSAAAVVAGIVLAGEISAAAGGEGLTRERVLELAAEREGHPDNAAPAVLGGLTIALSEPARAWKVPVTTLDAVTVLVPEVRLDTATARAAIPAHIAHAVAAENAARTGLLVHALTADAGALMEATADRLHQEFRRTAYPASMALVDDLRARGVPAVISGAGPTVLAFAGDVPAATGVRTLQVPIDTAGYRVTRRS